MVSTDPNDPNFGLETDVTHPNFGLPEQVAAPVPERPSAVAVEAARAAPNLGQAAVNAGEVATELIAGLPSMVEQAAKGVYDAAKFQVGTPQQRGEVVADILGQGAQIGRQAASDVQSPLGSKESFRGLAQLGMFAAPAIGELGIRPKLSSLLFGENKPPVQTSLSLTESLFGKEAAPVSQPTQPTTAQPLTETLFGKPETGGIENATQERQISESRVQQYPGDVEGGPPATPSNRGGVEPAAQVAGQEAVTPTTTAQDIKALFGTAKGAVTDSYIDAIWSKVQKGEPIQRMAPLENSLREAQKAGTLKTREDVAKIIEGYGKPSPVSLPASEATAPLLTQTETGVQARGQGTQVQPVTQESVAAVPQPESIKAAGVKYQDGTVETGTTHAEITGGGAVPLGAEDGFVTNTGRFVDAKEAHQIAIASKQLPPTQKGPVLAEDFPRDAEGQIEQPPSISEAGVEPSVPVSKTETGAPTEVGQPPIESLPGVTALTPDSPPLEVEPNVKGFEKVYGPGEIKAGESVTPEEIFRSGKAELAAGKDPYAIADRARTGDVSPKEIGLLAAEHDRLLHEAAVAEGTPEYEAKYQQAKDFAQNMLKPAGTKWHQTGMGLQVKAPVDLSNLTGFRAAFEERFGKEMTPDQANSFSQIAKDVARAKAEDAIELGRTAERVNKRFKGVKDMSFEDAVKSLHDEIKTKLKDCIL